MTALTAEISTPVDVPHDDIETFCRALQNSLGTIDNSDYWNNLNHLIKEGEIDKILQSVISNDHKEISSKISTINDLLSTPPAIAILEIMENVKKQIFTAVFGHSWQKVKNYYDTWYGVVYDKNGIILLQDKKHKSRRIQLYSWEEVEMKGEIYHELEIVNSHPSDYYPIDKIPHTKFGAPHDYKNTQWRKISILKKFRTDDIILFKHTHAIHYRNLDGSHVYFQDEQGNLYSLVDVIDRTTWKLIVSPIKHPLTRAQNLQQSPSGDLKPALLHDDGYIEVGE